VWGRFFAVGLLVTPSVACRSEEFRCETNAQCPDDGRCEPSGYCSVPADDCPSGRRYAGLSGSLSGECVPPDDGTGSAEGSTTAAESSAGSGTSPPTSTAGESSTTLPPETSSTSSTSGADPLVFIDDDAEDFGAGVPSATEYDDGLRLQPDANAGAFVSRVFDAQTPVDWTALEWTPRAPYSKPLPDDGADESGYDQGNISMADNVLLLHFDIGVGVVPGDAIEDTSGRDHPASVLGMGSVAAADPAIFTEGIALTPANSVEVDVSNTTDFQFGESDFTWSMWARGGGPCYSKSGSASPNQVYMGIEEGPGSGGAHMWLGCYNPAAGVCGATGGDGRVGSTMTAQIGDGLGSICGGPELIDDQWHHLALVKSGHDNATLTLWFDGQLVETTTVDYALPILFSADRPLQLGRLSEGYNATVELDEVAVFRRALSPPEIADLHLRGALQLAFQVRACDTPDCDGVPFVGPESEEAAVFRDGPSGPSHSTPPLHGRYFQYSVRFARQSVGLSREPVIDEVRVTADLE